jgi:hypothetical protein
MGVLGEAEEGPLSYVRGYKKGSIRIHISVVEPPPFFLSNISTLLVPSTKVIQDISSLQLPHTTTQPHNMKFLWVALLAATAAMAAPVAEPEAAPEAVAEAAPEPGYGSYPPPKGGYGSYPPPKGGYKNYPPPKGGYKNYPPPKGGYKNYKE